MIDVIFQGDSLAIQVTVLDQASGLALNLAGATVWASAISGATKIAGTTSITDAANGVIEVSWAAGILPAGDWQLHVRVAQGSSTQTVYSDTVRVGVSAMA
jgi:hypothetical protein